VTFLDINKEEDKIFQKLSSLTFSELVNISAYLRIKAAISANKERIIALIRKKITKKKEILEKINTIVNLYLMRNFRSRMYRLTDSRRTLGILSRNLKKKNYKIINLNYPFFAEMKKKICLIRRAYVKENLEILVLEINGNKILLVFEGQDKLLPQKIIKEQLKYPPIKIMNIIRARKMKITGLTLIVGGEIGGIQGLREIRLVGEDVISGCNAFASRHDKCRIPLYLLGAWYSVEIGKKIEISTNGTFKGRSIGDLIKFLTYII